MWIYCATSSGCRGEDWDKVWFGADIAADFGYPLRKDVQMKRGFEVKEFSPETWPDFETLFGKHKGVRVGVGVHSTVVHRRALTR
jgi:hypothetical protein